MLKYRDVMYVLHSGLKAKFKKIKTLIFIFSIIKISIFTNIPIVLSLARVK